MTPKEIKALIKALRENGVVQFKSGDIELTLAPQEIVSRETPLSVKVASLISPKLEAEDTTTEASSEIIHKVVEMTSLLKLDDAQLVDRLFPDHTDYGDDDEVVA